MPASLSRACPFWQRRLSIVRERALYGARWTRSLRGAEQTWASSGDDVQWGVESHPFSRSLGIYSRAGNGANELRRLSVARHLHDEVLGDRRRERGKLRQGEGSFLLCTPPRPISHAEDGWRGRRRRGCVSGGPRSRLDSCRPQTLLTHVKDLPNGRNKKTER